MTKYGIFNLTTNKFVKTDAIDEPDSITGWDYIAYSEVRAILDMECVESLSKINKDHKNDKFEVRIYE